jgi:hypothetical protein
VAIVGSAEFDVRDIDPSTLALAGVTPRRHGFEDVSSPSDGDACGCSESGGDGYANLTLKFRTPEILDALEQPLARGEDRVLTSTGALWDGTPVVANDCVVLRGGGP